MREVITRDVEHVSRVLLNGGIAGIPTETVYGLAADALNRDAVLRVFQVKGRPTHHPLIIHLHATEDMERWGVFNAHARSLCDAFCPGPITLLVPRTPLVPDWVTGGRNSVAIRFPSHQTAQDLLENVGTGLVAPSANKFGQVSPTTAQHVLQDLGEEVDIILDGGSCEIGVESTIVECINESVQVLRPGAVTSSQIAEHLQLPVQLTTGESRAPGMMLAHYAPKAKVVLVETAEEAENQIAVLRDAGHAVTMLFFPDTQQYAINLYDALRNADLLGVAYIVALLPEPSGLGIAIRDRLSKAAATY